MATEIKKALVTGGRGFIGSHLTERLVRAGARVSVFDLKEGKDLRNFEEVEKAVKDFQPEYIFHLGAIPSLQRSLQDPLATLNTNVLGTLNILQAARLCQVKRVILVSSAAVYGARPKNPNEIISEAWPLNILNPYALSKKWLEEAGRLWSCQEIWPGLETVSLRYFNVYGPRQPRKAAYASCIERFLYQWRNKKPLTIVPDGYQRRDFVHVFDVVEATLRAALSEKVGQGEVINIGSGKNYSIWQVAEIIGGKGYPTIFIDSRPGEARYVLADISRAKELLGWQPKISLEEGLKQLKNI